MRDRWVAAFEGILSLPILAHGFTDTFGLRLVVSNLVPSLK